MPSEEDAIQQAVIEHWLWFGLPHTLVAAVPNKRAFGQPGLTRGLYDLIVMSPLLGEKTGWLELKTKRGKLSSEQLVFGARCRMLGIPHAVATGRDEPIEWLRRWGAIHDPLRRLLAEPGSQVRHPAVEGDPARARPRPALVRRQDRAED